MPKSILSSFWCFYLATSLALTGKDLMSQQALQDEMTKLNDAAGLSTRLLFIDTDAISSIPEHQIIFPNRIFEKILQTSHVQHPELVARFLLAHEQAHQVQYKIYGADKILTADRELNRLKECQADIIGGSYLIRSIANANDQEQLAINEGIRDELEVAFDMGSLEKDADHPNRDARRTATRMGDAYGMAENMKNLQEHTQFLPDGQTLYMQAGASRQQLELIVDRRSNEDALEWSKRIAKRIVHFKHEAYSNLRLTKAVTHINSPNANSGTADFDLTFSNSGSTSITVDMEVQCITAGEKDVDDSSRWMIEDLKNYEYVLSPRASFEAKGILTWIKNTAHSIPRLVIPVRDDAALVSCIFTDQ
jgi:hypothetical protein